MTNKKIIQKIATNFLGLNTIMENELELYSNHPTLQGSAREDFWEDYFRRILPEKFTMVRNIIIMDSKEKFSKEVDIAVIDRQYTPYIFNYGSLRFVPIEAVAVVIESKSTCIDPDALIKWSKSIKKLKTCNVGVARMASGLTMGIYTGAQEATRPIIILASKFLGLSENNINELKSNFDMMMYFEKDLDKNRTNKYKLKHKIPNEDWTLAEWLISLNGISFEQILKMEGKKFKNLDIDEKTKKALHLKTAKSLKDIYGSKVDLDPNFLCALTTTLKDLEIPNNPLLSLNFQLNQLLMLINNPMLFPHYAYAKMFQKNLPEREPK